MAVRVGSWSTWLLGLGLLALTCLGLWLSWRARSDDPVLEWATIAIQVAFGVAAAVCWTDRHQCPNAVLLVLAGFLDGVSGMGGYAFWLISPKLNQIGYAFAGFTTPLVVLFLLRFPAPDTRFRGRRAFLVLVWMVAAEPVVRSLFWDWSAVGVEDPNAWWTLYPSRPVFATSLYLATAVAIVLAGWFVIEQRRRFAAAGRRPGQSLVRLISVLGIVLAVSLAVRSTESALEELGVRADQLGRVIGVVDNVLVAGSAVTILVATVLQAVRRTDVVERLLVAAGDPEAVQAALQRELGDPSLRIGFRFGSTWVDATGRAAPDRLDDGSRALLALAGPDGQAARARIDADRSIEDDPARLRVALAAAGLALENTRLTVERRTHLAELAASRTRLVQAGTEQRRRLERDLHDGAQQSLLGVAATLSRADLAGDEAGVREAVGEARQQLLAAIEELRRLARGIHPSALSQGGLGTALQSLASRTPRVTLDLDPDLRAGLRLPAPLETAAYFVVAEAVTNGLRHGGDGPVQVAAHRRGDHLEVVVTTSGPGQPRLVPGGGLSGLVDRVRALDGDLELRSRPDGGAVVSARMPLTGRAGP